MYFKGAHIESRIVGGYLASIAQVPWQVSLSYLNRHRCGGSIISRRWILTAAHCLTYRAPGDFDVVAGSENRNASRRYAVEALLIHERHRSHDYDVGLVKLKGE